MHGELQHGVVAVGDGDLGEAVAPRCRTRGPRYSRLPAAGRPATPSRRITRERGRARKPSWRSRGCPPPPHAPLRSCGGRDQPSSPMRVQGIWNTVPMDTRTARRQAAGRSTRASPARRSCRAPPPSGRWRPVTFVWFVTFSSTVMRRALCARRRPRSAARASERCERPARQLEARALLLPARRAGATNTGASGFAVAAR